MPNTSGLAAKLGELLVARGWKLAVAESCTGGGIAAALTDVAGSSEWFERGFVTYSNTAKQEMLGVDGELIRAHGAVSAEVATAMAAGALRNSRAQAAVAVTGIAGPGGGSAEKPVGTVWFGWAVKKGREPVVSASCRHFQGDRGGIRAAAVEHVLQELVRLVGSNAGASGGTG